jgi:hypothetical protein
MDSRSSFGELGFRLTLLLFFAIFGGIGGVWLYMALAQNFHDYDLFKYWEAIDKIFNLSEYAVAREELVLSAIDGALLFVLPLLALYIRKAIYSTDK